MAAAETAGFWVGPLKVTRRGADTYDIEVRDRLRIRVTWPASRPRELAP